MDNCVYLASCANYEEENVCRAVHDTLEAFGGAAALAGGKQVLIKANLLMSSTPEKAVTTHPSVITAIAREFVAAGCTVEIADSCGGVYNKSVLEKLYAVCGMKRAAESSGAILNYDTTSFERELPDGVRIKRVQMISPVERADFIISAAKMKTHGFAYYTGAVKNMFGVIPGLNKAVMHSRFPEKRAFCEMLVDLCDGVKPDLSIIDGIVGMEGAGPSGGEPKHAGVIIGARNPYAADLAAMRIMGLDEKKSYVHVCARSRGFVSDVEYIGESVEKFVTQFVPPYKRESKTLLRILPGAARAYTERFFASYPLVNSNKCVGCGECARACPESTITIREKKADINYKKCIRCYCCHELCPARAIDIKKFARYRKG